MGSRPLIETPSAPFTSDHLPLSPHSELANNFREEACCYEGGERDSELEEGEILSSEDVQIVDEQLQHSNNKSAVQHQSQSQQEEPFRENPETEVSAIKNQRIPQLTDENLGVQEVKFFPQIE